MKKRIIFVLPQDLTKKLVDASTPEQVSKAFDEMNLEPVPLMDESEFLY